MKQRLSKTLSLQALKKYGAMEFWQTVTPDDIEQLAADWIASMDDPESGQSDTTAEAILTLDYTAPFLIRLWFARAAVDQSTTIEHLREIAAGTIEHMLAWDGERGFQAVKKACMKDKKFLLAVTGVWKHRMDDKTWSDVQKLQLTSKSRLTRFGYNECHKETNQERVETSESIRKMVDELLHGDNPPR